MQRFAQRLGEVTAILNKVALVGAVVGPVGFLVANSVYTVFPGQRALIFDQLKKGTRKDLIMDPGMHFLIPFVQKPIIVDVRTTPFMSKTETGSKDLQTVTVSLRLLYRPDIDSLPDIYTKVGLDYANKVLNSISYEVLKSVIAQYDARELITLRETVSEDVRVRLLQRAETFGIVLEDVAITHISFTEQYIRAIEQKQVAQQQAERARFVVERSEQEKLAKIILAEAEAESARLITEAMSQGPGYIQLRRIEAARDIADVLSRSRNVTYLPGTGNMLLSLPSNQ